jgi:hypothetical protein
MGRKQKAFDRWDHEYKLKPDEGHIPNKSEAKLLRRLMSQTGKDEEQIRAVKKYRVMLAKASKKPQKVTGKIKRDYLEEQVTRTTGLPIEHPISKLEWNNRISHDRPYKRLRRRWPWERTRYQKKHFTKNDIKYLKENNMTYKQVDVQYDDETLDTVWVDTKVAKKGNRIEDKDVGKRGNIMEVYQKEELTEAELKETQRLARKFDNNI